MEVNNNNNNSNNNEDECSLPKATVLKIVTDSLPPDMQCAKETRALLTDCCIEFIHLLSSEANDICEREMKKTISPEHVLLALRELGFDEFIDGIQECWDEHKLVQKQEREKRVERLKKTDLNSEEVAKAQEEMFTQARLRLQQQQQQQEQQGDGS